MTPIPLARWKSVLRLPVVVITALALAAGVFAQAGDRPFARTFAAPGAAGDLLLLLGQEQGHIARATGLDNVDRAHGFPFGPEWSGGVRVALGDVTGDGITDYVTASGPGAGMVRIYDGQSVALVTVLKPFGDTFTGGVFVATGDVTGDGVSDLVMGAGTGPMVQVASGPDFTPIATAPVFDASPGGVHVAVGDVTGDGRAEILVAQGRGANVRLFDGATFGSISLAPYGPGWSAGINVAMGDINGDDRADIVIAPAHGAGRTRVFLTPALGELGSGVDLFGPTFTGGVRVAIGDLNGDGRADIATAPGPGTLPDGSTPHVRVFSGADFTVLMDGAAFGPSDAGGAFVAAPQTTRVRFTSANASTFRIGRADTFNVAAAGLPKVTSITMTGTLPAGVTFTDNGNGTATLAGTPAADTGGTYAVTFTASNGTPRTDTQTFTLTVEQAAVITSAAAKTFPFGVATSFDVTTTGYPAPALSVAEALPAGLTFTDDGDGTATLAGTPQAGSGGVHTLTIAASNGIGAPATQTFTLTIDSSPAFTSAAATTFVAGTAGSFTVTTIGVPTVTDITHIGALPPTITFTDNHDGTATLAGTPTTGGSYTLTLTATSGVGTDATQTFTLTVQEATQMPSTGAATFTVGAAGSAVITATGTPVPTLTVAGALPGGVSFTDNGDGTATLAGTPAAASGGVYTLTITATNGVGSDATQTFTLTVNEAPSFASAATTTMKTGVSSPFTAIAHGWPTPTLTSTPPPSGVTFADNGDGTATLGGPPAAGTGGSHTLTFTATNSVTSTPQTFTLVINEAPVFTSAATTTIDVGTSTPFTVTTTGYPTATLSTSSTLPSGVTFTNNGDGTATIGGTAASGTAGSYPLSIEADNGVDGPVPQNFTLEVRERPAITSANTTTFTTGQAGSFLIQTSGTPAATIALIGGMPPALSTLSVIDNGDGTASLAGTPNAGTGASYTLTFRASNASGDSPDQTFTLIVNQPPAITSAASATFQVGAPGSFGILATGYPTPTLSFTSGSLPSGVTLSGNTLQGTAAAGTGNQYALTLQAANGVGTNATQPFTLTVNELPVITSAPAMSFIVGTANSYTVTASGYPTPTITMAGTALPAPLAFSGPAGTGSATVSGNAVAGTGGGYNVTFTATNSVGSSAPPTPVTVSVQEPPQITSVTTKDFVVGQAGSHIVTTTGFPVPTVAIGGTAPPAGLTFTPATNTLSGTPTVVGLVSGITFTATNGVSPDANQSFSANIICPAITVTPSGAMADGLFNAVYSAVTYSATGSTGSSFTWSATGLPTGLSINTSSGQVSGTPTNTVLNAAVTISVEDNFGCEGTRSTTLTVRPNPDNDNFLNAVGNTEFVVGDLSTPLTPFVFVSDSVLNGDQGPGALSAMLQTAPTNGTLVLNANGTFVYQPNAGFAGPTDTFTYQLIDGNGITNLATATINIAERVWYVNNSYGGGAGVSNGTSRRPFTTMGAADTAASSFNDIVFVHTGSGTTTGSITLDTGQQLRGQGTAFSVRGLTIAATTKPTLGGTVIIAGSNVTVSAVDISTGASTGFSVNAGAFTNLTVANNVNVTTTSGTGILLGSLSGSTVAFNTVTASSGTALVASGVDTSTITFRSISAGGATYGMRLSNVNSTSGSFTVTGGGTAGSGGTILSATQRGAEIVNAKNVTLNWMTFTGNGTADGPGAAGTPATCGDALNGTNTGCNAGIYLQDARDVTLNRVGVSGGAQIGINANNVTNLAMTNVAVQNVGNDNLEDGVQLVDVDGTVTVTDSTFSGNFHRQFELQNHDGNTTATFTRVTFDRVTYISTAGQGLLVAGHNSAVMNVTVKDSDFRRNFGTAFTGQGVNNAQMTFLVGDTSVAANGNLFEDNSLALQMLTDNAATMDTTIANNLIQLTPSTPVTGGATPVTFRKGTGATGLYRGVFNNNQIGNGTANSGNNCNGCNGVSITNDAASGNMYMTVSNNTIQNIRQRGVEFLGQMHGAAGIVVTNNQFLNPEGTPGSRVGHAIFLQSGTDDADSGSLCAEVSGNGVAGVWDVITSGNIRLRLSPGETGAAPIASFRVRNVTGSPITTTDVVNFLNAANTNALATATTTGFAAFTGGGTPSCIP